MGSKVETMKERKLIMKIMDIGCPDTWNIEWNESLFELNTEEGTD